ncbi:MAG: hypothetical protein QOJ62_1070 [Actinomycetota bacterium]|nr:hypothetical protein [Actinomycetota bacterium]
MHLSAIRRLACSLAIGFAAAGIATAAPAAAVTAAPVPKVCTAADITISGKLATGHITAVTKPGHADCVLSFNSYATQGASWPTSGTQTFVGHDSGLVTVDGLTLTVTLPTGFCQLDLYGSATAYDGNDGPLPHYPNVVVVSLIAPFNGTCGSTTSASVSASETNTATITPPAGSSSSSIATVIPTVLGESFSATDSSSASPSISPSVLGIIFTKKPPLTAPKAKPPVATLPFTGVPLVPALTIGFGLVLAGALLLGSTRRHRLRRVEF